jgi:hypothetical protein
MSLHLFPRRLLPVTAPEVICRLCLTKAGFFVSP